jgi:para-aminobenzoate synthetase component 1
MNAELAALEWSGRDGFFWLDANGRGGATRMWSYVGHSPVERRSDEPEPTRPFEVLDGLDAARDAGEFTHAPRWVGFVAYDAFSRSWTRSPSRHAPRSAPNVVFARYAAVLAISPEGTTFAVGDDEDAVTRLLGSLTSSLTRPGSREVTRPVVARGEATSRTAHERAIETALEHVRAGDIYQVNLARRWTGTLEGDAFGLFWTMRTASAVPLGFFFETGHTTVAARTMETYLEIERGETTRVICRPIKGTIARRGNDEGEAKELAADPKEHAEHVMIVDLIRNDLGRIAKLGTVRVEDLLTVEPYARLSHLVSTVVCEIEDSLSLRTIVQETFPPGSVTGTPKIRAMEIIDALEPFSRGLYCGTVGMIRRDGGALFAVAIRTATITNRVVEYFAGGGLVAASDPAKEVAETELKARVFFDACGTEASAFEERDDA